MIKLGVKEFLELTNFLRKWGIYFSAGCFYDNDNCINGHWIKICSQGFETDMLTPIDIKWNERMRGELK